MINGVIRLALRYRGLVLLLALVVMVYGSYLATTLPISGLRKPVICHAAKHSPAVIHTTEVCDSH